MQLVPIVQQTANPNLPSASAAWTTVAPPLPCRWECPLRAPLLCAIFQHRGRDSKPLTGTVASCAWCVGARIRALDQELPCTLQIRDCRDGHPQLTLLLGDALIHLALDVLRGSNRCDAL